MSCTYTNEYLQLFCGYVKDYIKGENLICCVKCFVLIPPSLAKFARDVLVQPVLT